MMITRLLSNLRLTTRECVRISFGLPNFSVLRF